MTVYIENDIGTTSAGGFAALAPHIGCRTSQWRRAVASGTASLFAMGPIWNSLHGVLDRLRSVEWEYCCNDVSRIV